MVYINTQISHILDETVLSHIFVGVHISMNSSDQKANNFERMKKMLN